MQSISITFSIYSTNTKIRQIKIIRFFVKSLACFFYEALSVNRIFDVDEFSNAKGYKPSFFGQFHVCLREAKRERVNEKREDEGIQ